MARETEKFINFKGKQIRIRKFSVLDGCYIMQKILSAFLPEAIEKGLGFNRPFSPKREMTRDEFSEMLVNVMQYVTYIQKEPISTEIPVLNDNGSIGVEDFDFSDIFLLAIEVLLYNCLGFFTSENLEHFAKLMADATRSVNKTIGIQD